MSWRCRPAPGKRRSRRLNRSPCLVFLSETASSAHSGVDRMLCRRCTCSGRHPGDVGMLQAFPLYYILNISGPRRDRRGNAERPIYHDHRLAVSSGCHVAIDVVGLPEVVARLHSHRPGPLPQYLPRRTAISEVLPWVPFQDPVQRLAADPLIRSWRAASLTDRRSAGRTSSLRISPGWTGGRSGRRVTGPGSRTKILVAPLRRLWPRPGRISSRWWRGLLHFSTGCCRLST